MRIWNWKKIKRYFLLQCALTTIAVILHDLVGLAWGLVIVIIVILMSPFLWKWAMEDYKRMFGDKK